MKRPTRPFLLSAALVSLCLWAAPSLAAPPLPVVASFSILGDLLKVVGGDRVKVSTLVGPDADAHAFEPTPADARNLLNARLFVTNGLNFEPWAQKLAQSANYKGALLNASQGIQPRQRPAESGLSHNEADPHAWQDPRNVVIYINNITQSLASLDPEGASSYRQNRNTYIRQLEALDQFALAQFAPLTPRQRRVITSHDAFGYFAARYQIQFLAPQGVSPASEASAKEVALLIRQIQRDKIRAVFVENMRNPKLLAQIAQDTGVKLGPKLYVDALSGPSEPGFSYLSMMRHNVMQLVAGMMLN